MTHHSPNTSLGFPDIPEDRIAQVPLVERDRAKLMVLNRSDGSLSHRVFSDLVDLVPEGDALVLNDVKVLPARLFGKKPTGGRVTVLLLARYMDPGPERWSALVSPRPRVGADIHFPDGLFARVKGPCADGEWELEFSEPVDPVLARWGRMPLPPYIKRPPEGNADDWAAYQTVYSTEQKVIPGNTIPEKADTHLAPQPVPQGAVAAPTAGLHFTPDLLEKMRKKGVRVHFVTLWVGWGTFRPIATEDIRAHRMLPEPYRVPHETADALRAVRREGKNVWAVGTTAVRTLESAAEPDRTVRAGTGTASLYITPGYSFRAVDRLITNFHMPGHTPLVLTAAFAGLDPLRQAYNEALAKNYRFFSYGDAMVIS